MCFCVWRYSVCESHPLTAEAELFLIQFCLSCLTAAPAPDLAQPWLCPPSPLSLPWTVCVSGPLLRDALLAQSLPASPWVETASVLVVSVCPLPSPFPTLFSPSSFFIHSTNLLAHLPPTLPATVSYWGPGRELDLGHDSPSWTGTWIQVEGGQWPTA